MKKIFIFLCASLLCANISYTCWFADGEEGYKFFNTDNIGDATLLFFVDYDAGLGLGYSEKAKEPKDGNLQAWAAYLKTEASDEDLAALIYKMPSADLEKILKDKNALSAAAGTNAVLSLLQKNKKLRDVVGKYLLYAKKCEVEAMKASDYWSDEIVRDPATMKKMMAEGLQAAKKSKDKFLKQRYAFQALRVAFYMGDNESVLSLFDEHFGKVQNPDYAYFRALEVKAGAHRRKADAEAPYYFAKVFLNCPDRRTVCLNSFSFTTEEDWERSVKLCKTNEERAVFYAMRGLQPAANIVEELENIGEVAPTSPLLEMLLARHIGRIQNVAFSPYNLESGFPSKELDNMHNMPRLKAFMNKMIQNKEIQNKDFWTLATAYVELLNRNNEGTLKILTGIPTTSPLKKQATVIGFVAQLCAVQKLDAATADALWSEYKSNEILNSNENLQEFVKDVFSMLYQKQGDKARAFLAYNQLYDMRGRLDLSLLDALDFFLNNNRLHGKYDNFLVDERCGGLINSLNVLHEMRGVYFLQHNQLDKAIAEFEKCDAKHQREGEYFNSSYLDKTIWSEFIKQPYFSSEIETQATMLYEKYSFLKKDYNLLSYTKQLKELESKATSDAAMSAEYYYLLGLAWHNTSTFGWHRPAINYATDNDGNSIWWGADTKEESLKDYKTYFWSSHRYYNPDMTINYLEKALKASDNNKELQAKITYLLALVEKNRELATNDWWGDEPTYSEKYWDYFKSLKTNYANTAYYKDVLRECYDFELYLNK